MSEDKDPTVKNAVKAKKAIDSATIKGLELRKDALEKEVEYLKQINRENQKTIARLIQKLYDCSSINKQEPEETPIKVLMGEMEDVKNRLKELEEKEKRFTGSKELDRIKEEYLKALEEVK